MQKAVVNVIMIFFSSRMKNAKSEFIVSPNYGFSNLKCAQISASVPGYSGKVEPSSVSFLALAVGT